MLRPNKPKYYDHRNPADVHFLIRTYKGSSFFLLISFHKSCSKFNRLTSSIRAPSNKQSNRVITS